MKLEIDFFVSFHSKIFLNFALENVFLCSNICVDMCIVDLRVIYSIF